MNSAFAKWAGRMREWLDRYGRAMPLNESAARELASLLEAAEGMRVALEAYSECSDGCTCGDGWSHDAARAALAAGHETALVGGQRVAGVHPVAVCADRVCCIHNPSDHHMATWPQNWRQDRGIMERVCTHGVGHPDPDDAAYRASRGDVDTVHGCCGCCGVPA